MVVLVARGSSNNRRRTEDSKLSCRLNTHDQHGNRQTGLEYPRTTAPPRATPNAAHSQSMRQRCGQDERKHLRDRVSPPRTTPWTQSDHWGHCPSALSPDLDNLAPRGPLRGRWPGRMRKAETNTHCENDPPTPKPRLPRRIADCSTQPSMRPGAGGGFSTLPTSWE
jgi:hypothetical protein